MQKRTSPSNVVARRQARQIIAYHTDPLEDWQTRASFLAARLSSLRVAHSERLQTLIEVRDLLGKVERARQQFTLEAQPVVETTKYEVAAMAFDRLVTKLSSLE